MPVVVMPFSLSLCKRVNTVEHRNRQAAGIMAALMPRELIAGHQESKGLIFPSSWLLLCTVLPVKRQGNTDMYLHDLLSIMIHSDLIGKAMSL